MRPARVLALVPFFFLVPPTPPASFFIIVSPPWRRQLRPGQKRPTKEGRKKNKTRASKRGHNRNQTDPSIPASRSDWLVFPPRGKDHCTKVLPAWGGTTSRRTDEAGFEGMGPDTDALLVGLICGPADLWPDPGSKPIMLSMAPNSVLQVATPGPVPGKKRRETKPQKLPARGQM